MTWEPIDIALAVTVVVAFIGLSAYLRLPLE